MRPQRERAEGNASRPAPSIAFERLKIAGMVRASHGAALDGCFAASPKFSGSERDLDTLRGVDSSSCSISSRSRCAGFRTALKRSMASGHMARGGASVFAGVSRGSASLAGRRLSPSATRVARCASLRGGRRAEIARGAGRSPTNAVGSGPRSAFQSSKEIAIFRNYLGRAASGEGSPLPPARWPLFIEPSRERPPPPRRRRRRPVVRRLRHLRARRRAA